MPNSTRNLTSSRPEPSNDDEGYTHGSIVTIKLENIYTYDSVEFTCGPHLNVIIGPNGTGKSTIVCAICLGLGGKTNLLGRAQQASEFIKYGADKGRIEIELFNSNGPNHQVVREIMKDNTSKWKIQGKACPQKAVDDLVKSLNIQVGNLTQFLPQDRVSEFAKMNSAELLESTEKAVGDPEMYNRHVRLKDSQKDTESLALQIKNLHETLQQEEQKNSRIEADVKNFQERENYLEKIKILNMKRVWVVFEEKRLEYMDCKKAKEELEKKLRDLRAAHQPLQRKLDQAAKAKETITTQKKTNATDLKEVAKKNQAITEQVDSLTDQIVELQDELKLKKDQEQARQKKLKDLRKQLEALQVDIKKADEMEDVQPQLNEVNKTLHETSQELSRLHRAGEEIKIHVESHRKAIDGLTRELQGLRNVENRRLETLRKKHKDTYDAVMWLRQNKAMFKGEIQEPPMISVNMNDPNMAKYLENHISFNDMRAFICENSEDLNLFMNKVREEQNLRVNAARTPPNFTERDSCPKVPIENYRRYGFFSYMKDLFTCPEAVMKYLCAQYKVHTIPIGDNKTQDMVSEIQSKFQELTLFYTSNSQYNIRKSRYDGSVSSKRMELRDPSLLTVSIDKRREEELLGQHKTLTNKVKELETQYSEKQQQSKDLDRQMNKLREERKNLQFKKEIKNRLKAQIEAKKKAIEDSEKDAVNLEKEEDETDLKMRKINNKKLQLTKDYLENTRKCVEGSRGKVELCVRLEDSCRLYQKLEAEIREETRSLQQAEVDYRRAKERVNENKLEAKRLLNEAKKATNTETDEGPSPQVKCLLESLPSTLAEIDAKIHEHEVRAQCVGQTDKRVVEEYNNRLDKINKLKEDVKKKEDERDNHQEEVNNAKTLWLDPLNQLIARINTSFSYFFTCLNCVGEVDLYTPENKEDYSKYGIRIRVKFRDNEPLQDLSAHRQSGGERSVTTVLYMMALQDLTRCPFRCVDEINQGMDPANERKVFELVVQTVCRKNTSQYFLLTPKLLPDLEYADNMTVLCVANGPHMMDHTQWNLTDFISRRRQLDD